MRSELGFTTLGAIILLLFVYWIPEPQKTLTAEIPYKQRARPQTLQVFVQQDTVWYRDSGTAWRDSAFYHDTTKTLIDSLRSQL